MVGNSRRAQSSRAQSGGKASLEGTTAIITGGATGIGLACARRLVAEGVSVMLVGRTASKLEVASEALKDLAPATESTTVQWRQADVTREAELAAAVGEACAIQGRLDHGILSAGIGAQVPLLSTSTEQWSSIIETNLTGAFLAIKHVGHAMAAANGGSIVAISSIAAAVTHRYVTAYAVSKAAVDALVKNAADELGPRGVRINAVRPGLVETDMTSHLFSNERVVGDYRSQTPLRRAGGPVLAEPDDIADTVRFLVGPESAWITGQCLGVDGGHSLRRGPDLEPEMRAEYGDAAVDGEVMGY